MPLISSRRGYSEKSLYERIRVWCVCDNKKGKVVMVSKLGLVVVPHDLRSRRWILVMSAHIGSFQHLFFRIEI